MEPSLGDVREWLAFRGKGAAAALDAPQSLLNNGASFTSTADDGKEGRGTHNHWDVALSGLSPATKVCDKRTRVDHSLGLSRRRP
jgi:hypothetical protein